MIINSVTFPPGKNIFLLDNGGWGRIASSVHLPSRGGEGLLEGQGNKNMNGVRNDDAGAVSTAVSNEVVRTRPVQSQVSPPESTEPRSERIMQTFRSLFSPYPAGPSTSYAGARNQSRPLPAKKRKSLFRVKETWTHEFFCLASTAATCVPSNRTELNKCTYSLP